MAKDAQVVAHVERAVKQALEELAQEDGRRLSSYVERLLLRHLQEKKRLQGAKRKASKERP
jgi:hypothetical protein